MNENNSELPGYQRPTFSSNEAAQVGKMRAEKFSGVKMRSQRNAQTDLHPSLSPPQEKKTRCKSARMR